MPACYMNNNRQIAAESRQIFIFCSLKRPLGQEKQQPNLESVVSATPLPPPEILKERFISSELILPQFMLYSFI